MSKVYRDIKQFCIDVTHPYICSLRLIMDPELKLLQDFINAAIVRVAAEILVVQTAISAARTMLTTRLNSVETYFVTKYLDLTFDLAAHKTENNNPHNLQLPHLVTVSSVTPSNVQGVTGDIWVEYETNYTVV